MSSSSPKKKSLFSSWIKRLFLFCLLCILALLALAPTILSSSWGKEKLTTLINQSIPGQIKIESLNLSWFGPQQMQGLSLADSQGVSILNLENGNANTSLFALLSNPTTSGSIELNALNLHLIGDSEGNTNLIQALNKNCCLKIEGATPVTIDLKNARSKLNLSENGPVTLHIEGETSQNSQQGNFLIDAELRGITIREVIKSDQDLVKLLASRPDAQLKIQADIRHFPVELLDQIASLRSPKFTGLLTETLGNQLNLKINQNTMPEGIFLNIDANTPTLSFAANVLLNKELTLAKPAEVKWNLTPSAANKLVDFLKINTPWQLSAPTSINLSINQLQLPLNFFTHGFNESDLNAIGLIATLDLDQATLKNTNKTETILLKETHASVSTEPYTLKAEIKIAAEAIHQEEPTRINLNLSLPKASLLQISNLPLHEVTTNGEIRGFPFAVLDSFIKSTTPPSVFLGDRADILFSFQMHQNRPTASFQLKSDTIEIPQITLSLENQKLILNKPTQVTLQLPHTLVNRILQEKGPLVQGPTTAILTVNSLSLPRIHPLSSLKMMYAIDLEATLKLTAVRLINVPSFGAMSVNDFSLRLFAKPRGTPELSTSFNLQPDGTSTIADVFGKKTSVKASTTLGLGPDGHLTANLFNLEIINNLAQLEMSGGIHEDNHLVAIDFNGISRLGDNQAAGKISGSAKITEWLKEGSLNLQGAVVSINANANTFPTELISALSGQKDLTSILGNAFDFSLLAKAGLSGQTPGNLFLDINSQNLACRLNLLVDRANIQLDGNRLGEISFKLTPQAYTALRGRLNTLDTNDFILTEPTTAFLTLRSLRIPRSLPFFQAAIEADFSLERLTAIDPHTKKKLILDSLQGQLRSEQLSELIYFEMKGKGNDGEGKITSLNMSGSLKKGFTTEGQLNRKDLSLSLNASIDSIPVPFLCRFMCLDSKIRQKFEVLIGPILNASIQAQLHQMNGPFFADIQGSNGRFTLDAYLNDGILMLNKDLTAQLTVTPQFGEYALKDVIPFLGGMLSAERPLYLTIHKEGFFIPMRNPSVLSVNIEKASLDIGKVRFAEHSQMVKMLTLLTANPSNQLIWMTPAYFSLKDGLLKLDRVDMLIGNLYPIASWGDVDIGKDRVNMTVGLSGASITQAFRVPGIAPDYFLQLPLKGRLNNASIDKTKATARISALAAHSQGGPQGLVLGTVLDIASGSLAESSVPPPTTQPLPWQELLAKQETDQESERAESLNLPNPIEEIGKGASSLIKKIFK